MRRFILTLAGFCFAGSLLAVADDLEYSYQSLQEAVAKKDIAQVKKLAADTSAIARKVIAEPAPTDPAEKKAWTQRVAHAKEVDTYTEYALYSTAVSAPPETLIDLITTLEAQNPKSKYLEGGYLPYFTALSTTGAAAKIPELAQKALAILPNDEDLLLVVMDAAYSKGNRAQAAVYAERLIAALAKHPKPDTIAAADWERKRGIALGRAYWTAGVVHYEKQQFYQADQDLRAALPFIKGIDAMLGPALFDLGVANYNLGKQFLKPAQIREGASFSEQAAKIPGPHAQQAWTNSHLMKAEADKLLVRK